MNADKLTVLFLCTGNSARSIMAEAILNKIGQPRFSAYSAGSNPTGRVNPLAIELLASLHYSTNSLRSKSWSGFAHGEFSGLDIVITVCDSAAAEPCPVWPGHPVQAHWGLPDPASVQGSHAERLSAFRQVYQELESRIRHLLKLRSGEITREQVKRRLMDIGKMSETKEGRDDRHQ
jgi:arsenate reductase